MEMSNCCRLRKRIVTVAGRVCEYMIIMGRVCGFMTVTGAEAGRVLNLRIWSESSQIYENGRIDAEFTKKAINGN